MKRPYHGNIALTATISLDYYGDAKGKITLYAVMGKINPFSFGISIAEKPEKRANDPYVFTTGQKVLFL